MRKCMKCGEEKSLESYRPHRHSTDGIDRWCMTCRSESQRARTKARWDQNPYIPSPEKQCTQCKQMKPMDLFYRASRYRDGRTSVCKDCTRSASAKEKEARRLSIPAGMKYCGKCKQIKSVDMFNRNKSTKDGLGTECRECVNNYLHDWYQENRISVSIVARAWRQANRDKKQATDKAWATANRERVRQNKHAKYLEHRDERLKQSKENGRRWRKNNPEKNLAKNRRHRAANLDKYRLYAQKRRAQLAGVGGRGVTEQDIQAMIYCQMGLCAYCERDGQKLTLDHIIPIDQGGPHDPDNCCMACGVCNSSKGNRTPEEWEEAGRWFDPSKK